MPSITELFYDGKQRRPGPLARGYLLWFEVRERPCFPASAGTALLLIFLVFEFVVGPRASILVGLGIAPPPASARILVLLGGVLLSVRLIAGLKLRDIGLFPPSAWRPDEALYLGQIVLIAIGLFIGLRAEPAGHGAPGLLLAAGIGTSLIWGFYQELVYRGILQTELTRRFGGVTGALGANLAFTFGPLHFYHLADGTAVSAAVMMAAIFAIGLIFSFIYARTRNILLVGILHGIGNVFTSGAG